ncbi:MAG: DinB family protein [Flavisolibacter sp.]
MQKFKSEELIDQLEKDARQVLAAAEHLRTADPVKLGYCAEEGTWSVAQVIDHLNRYSKHYLPLIEKSMIHIPRQTNAWFVSGFWGNYFTKLTMPKNVYEVKNRMKTGKVFSPEKSVNVQAVFNEFIQHQNKLLQLLEVAKRRNLNTIHIPVTFGRFFRFRLGDIFRYLVAHQQRHMIQARNTIKAVGISTDKFPVILEAARL